MEKRQDNILLKSEDEINFKSAVSLSLSIGINTSRTEGKSIARHFAQKLAPRVERHLNFGSFCSEWFGTTISTQGEHKIEKLEELLGHVKRKIQNSDEGSLVLFPVFMHCGRISQNHQDGYNSMFSDCQCEKDQTYAFNFLLSLKNEIVNCKGKVLIILETCLPMSEMKDCFESSVNVLAVCGSDGKEQVRNNKGLSGFVLKQCLKHVGGDGTINVKELRGEMESVHNSLMQLRKETWSSPIDLWTDMKLRQYEQCWTRRRGDNILTLDEELWEDIDEDEKSRTELDCCRKDLEKALQSPLESLSGKVKYLSDDQFRLTVLSIASQLCCSVIPPDKLSSEPKALLHEAFSWLWNQGLKFDDEEPESFVDFCVFLVNVVHQMRKLKKDDREVVNVVKKCAESRAQISVSANCASDSADGQPRSLKPPNLDCAIPKIPVLTKMTPDLFNYLKTL